MSGADSAINRHLIFAGLKFLRASSILFIERNYEIECKAGVSETRREINYTKKMGSKDKGRE